MIVGARAASRDDMRAAFHPEWGVPLEFGRRPRPEPAAGEVRVALRATSVNPIDITTGLNAGYEQSMQLPFVPGWDVAGVIDAIGYGVTRHRLGDRVFGLAAFPYPAGTYAEYTAVPAFHLAALPGNVSFTQGGCVPMAALTAWQMLTVAEVGEGTRVLISGATGGVGHLAVQLAHERGADVIALGRQRHHPTLRLLGAATCVDYTDRDALAMIEPVDALIDYVGHQLGRSLFDRIKRGGIAALATAWSIPTYHEDAMDNGIIIHSCLVEPDLLALTAIADLLQRDQVRAVIGAEFSLANAQQAQSWVSERRGLGKAAILIESEDS